MDNNGTATRIAGNLSQAMGPSTTTTTFPNAQYQYGQLSGNLGQYYSYQWPYYYDHTVATRVASLEGEVKVLREMVAALLSGRAPKASAKR